LNLERESRKRDCLMELALHCHTGQWTVDWGLGTVDSGLGTVVLAMGLAVGLAVVMWLSVYAI